MWDGFDKRKFPRLRLQCEIVIEPPDANTPPIRAVTENVGEGGVCIIQDKPLERFSRCHLRLELDKDLPRIECAGKVVWNIPHREPLGRENKFDTGIEFLEMKPEDREKIRSFIQSILPKGFRQIS
ncbi:MAG TPA: PilZ domain-containing protein [bacterium]|nr:PilZ domain-containing protein [bacterium]